MKLHHFRDVVAIAEQGSLRAAARWLQLAQPALTRSLGELERELGAPLFERRARGMALTQAGRAFYQRATLVLNQVQRARDDVGQLSADAGGDLVVALSIAAHIALLPTTLRPFRQRYPNVKLHLIEGLYPTLEGDLRSGNVDLYVGPQPSGPIAAELSREELFANTRTIICRVGHPLVGAASLADLAEAEWTTTSVTLRAGEELNSLFERHDLPLPRLAMRCQSALSVLMAVACSDLLAMVPVQWSEPMGRPHPLAGILDRIAVREILPAPTIVLIRRADIPLTPAALYFRDLVIRGVPRQPV
jgi:LysR family transcriptional regulator of abg operon